jgi:hypothetical protein
MENKSLLQTNFLAGFRVQTFVASSKPAANIKLSKMAGDKFILNFLFTIRLQFQQTNNAGQ